MAEAHAGGFRSQPGDPAQWGFAAPSALRRVSWGALIAGALIALIVHLMLTLLGLGVGAMTLEPTGGQAVPEGLGIGAAIWSGVSVLIAMFVGGWFAGYLAGAPEKTDGALHGLVAFALATLVSLWLVTSAAGTLFAGAGSAMQGPLGQQAEQGQAPQAMQQAGQQGEQAADTAASAVAQAGLWGFIVLLLGAVVAGLGGMLGAPADAPYTHYHVEAGPEERHTSEAEQAHQRRIERERAEQQHREQGEPRRRDDRAA